MKQRKTPVGFLAALGAAIMIFAFIAPAAGARSPAPGYGEFAACPDRLVKPEIATCIRVNVTGGHFQMGNKDTPIVDPIVLSGGVNGGGSGFQGTMSGGKEKVPGGVIGLTGLVWLAEFLGVEALTLYAQTELAGTPELLTEPAVLPIKVHLINAVLGNKCYVGSTSSPIVLHLTTHTTSPPPPNKPITGKDPEVIFEESTEIIRDLNGEFVDNSFSAPGASGCVLTLFGFIPISINGLVNTQSGLPAAAGTNETRQNFNLALTDALNVWP
jgi:hypothetical protein